MIWPPSPRTTSPQAAAPSPKMRPPSTWARTRSGLTVMPQSSAKVIFSTWTRLRLSREISVTWALWLSRKLLQATPRARPSGSGDPQPPRSAASSSARRVRGLPASRSRRRSTGSRPAAMASSSIADSRANSVCELPTERHTMMGTPVWTLVVSSLKLASAYGPSTAPVVVKIVDAAFDQHIGHERQVGEVGSAAICWWKAVRRPRRRRRPGPGARPSPGTGRTLELLLAQRLDLDRVLPVQRPRDLHGLAGRVGAGGAVQAERPAGVRDVHPYPVLVRRRPPPRPPCGVYSGDSVLAQTSRMPSSPIGAHGVVRFHRRVRQVRAARRSRRSSASRRRAPRATSPSSRATTACSPDSTSRRCSASSSSELRRSACCSSQSTRSARSAPLRVVERLADDRDTLARSGPPR